MRFQKVGLVCLVLLLTPLVGCTSNKALYEDLEPRIEYYDVSYRQAPHEPVYSRLAWSHLPKPVVAQEAEKAPLLLPVILFDLPNSNLREALEALSQTIGYRLEYPRALAGRSVSIVREATVDVILTEIGRQARVETELDHNARTIRVVDGRTQPLLPMVRGVHY